MCTHSVSVSREIHLLTVTCATRPEAVLPSVII